MQAAITPPQPIAGSLAARPAANAPQATMPVEIDHLGLSFGPDAPPALDDVSLHIAPGEFVSLIGPSGCGKTSLLNLCAGLVPHRGSGEIQVCGAPPCLGSHDVAYMLARDSLLPWRTALDNACLGMEMR